METIVKGKHIKYNYSVSDWFFPFLRTYRFISPWFHSDKNGKVKQYNNSINMIREFIVDLQKLNIKKFINTNKIVLNYETFYNSKELDFQLHDNNELYIGENIYKVEKVVGTDKNQIIYYVNKELSIIDNVEQYKEVENEIKRIINIKIFKLESYIKEYQQDIQCIIEQNNKMREGKYNESLKEDNNKESWKKRVVKKYIKIK